MAAEVKKVVEGKEKSIFILTNDAVGGGESGVTKVDISTLPGAPARVKVSRVEVSADQGGVLLYYDRSSAIRIATLADSGCVDFGMEGGIEDTGTGGTGDIKLTTLGSPTFYTVIIHIKADAS